MEILSDTVFHGDVSIGTLTNPKTLKLYTNGNGNVLTIGQTGNRTEILETDGIAKFYTVNVDSSVTANSFCFNSTGASSGIYLRYSDKLLEFSQGQYNNLFIFGCREYGKIYCIATQDQIPSMDGVAHVQSLPITFDVPAECTRFYMPGVNSITPYSIQLFKHNETTGESGDFVKNVDLGIVCGSKVNNTGSGPRGAVVVEKSSSFAMSSTDGYSIRIVY